MKDIKEFLENAKVHSESIKAIKFDPGAKYLIVINDRLVGDMLRNDLVEGLYKTFGIKVAVIVVYGEPDEVIAAFKIKE